MPAPIQDSISLEEVSRLSVGLEPAHNAIQSLSLLAKSEHFSGLNEWILGTDTALSAEERFRHRLVMLGFYYAVLPEQSWPSFPAYLSQLDRLSATTLRDKLLLAYAEIPAWKGKHLQRDEKAAPVEWETVLSSSGSFLSFLRERFGEDNVDPEIETQAYALIKNPSEMKDLIVSHLRKMWENHLSREWERALPILQDTVRAFQQIDFSQMDRLEAGRLITGQALEEGKWREQFEQADRITFIPNPHIGPYLWKVTSGNTLGIFFGPRLPKGAIIDAPDLTRTEINVRLSALADDTRLQILKMISETGEQRSQDIMQALQLSQSAASRHLTHLSATGFLSERRCDGSKCYILNSERIEETLQAISAFLLGK